MLCLESFTLENDDTVFIKDLSVSLEAGQVLAVIGPSQSGKTFFLNALACGKVCSPDHRTAVGFFARRKLRKTIPDKAVELVDKQLGLTWSDIFSKGASSRGQEQLRGVIAHIFSTPGDVCLLDTPLLNMDIMTKRKLCGLLPELLGILGKSAVATSTEEDLPATLTIHMSPTLRTNAEPSDPA